MHHSNMAIFFFSFEFVVDRAVVKEENCVLGTMSDKNVAFYSKLGFQVVRESWRMVCQLIYLLSIFFCCTIMNATHKHRAAKNC